MYGVVLSLFPGADLFGHAFAEDQWCVVRGPDVLLGGDIRAFDVPSDGRYFDGIIGGPPCTSFSQAIAARGGAEAARHGNLIPEFERIVRKARPEWWIMENVPEAPTPQLPNARSWLYDAHLFGAAQHRTRRFSSNLDLDPFMHVLPESQRHSDPWPTITATEYKCSAGSNQRTMRQRAGRKVGRKLTLEEMREAMGVKADWAMPALLKSVQYEVLGNGVPMQMGKALAVAVRNALLIPKES